LIFTSYPGGNSSPGGGTGKKSRKNMTTPDSKNLRENVIFGKGEQKKLFKTGTGGFRERKHGSHPRERSPSGHSAAG